MSVFFLSLYIAKLHATRESWYKNSPQRKISDFSLLTFYPFRAYSHYLFARCISLIF